MSRIDRRPWLGVLVVVSAFVISCGGSGDSAGKKEGCVLDELGGAVTINGETATKNQQVASGSQIEVPHKAFARLEFADGTRIFLVGKTQEGTSFTVGEPKDDGGVQVMLVKLGKGVLTFLVPESVKGKGRYEVEAESSLTVIRGTEGKVEITGTSDIVALKKGTVDVTPLKGGDPVKLDAGHQVTIPQEGSPQPPTMYDYSTPEEQELYQLQIKGVILRVINERK